MPDNFRGFMLLILLSGICQILSAADLTGSSAMSPPTSTDSIPIQSQATEASESNALVHFQGTVTLVDPGQQLVVLQDGEQSKALRMDLPMPDVTFGDWVELEGRPSPLIDILPHFPGPTRWFRDHIAI